MTEEMKNISVEELGAVSGGVDGKRGLCEGPEKVVMNLKTGWLALRTSPNYDPANEIGQLFNDDIAQIIGNGSGPDDNGQSYVWVYSKRLDKSGWVNDKFIG